MANDSINTPAANMPSAAEMARILQQGQAKTEAGGEDLGQPLNNLLALAKNFGLADRKGLFVETQGFGSTLGFNKQGLPDTFGKTKGFFQKRLVRDFDSGAVLAGIQHLPIEPVGPGTGGMPDSTAHIQGIPIQAPAIGESGPSRYS